jgi:hypothetical protein
MSDASRPARLGVPFGSNLEEATDADRVREIGVLRVQEVSTTFR